MATQLMETEHVLSQERQQAVRAMNQASNLQRQNEQLKKYNEVSWRKIDIMYIINKHD